MSDKSENLRHGPDMSSFEAQFAGSDDFDTLLRAQKDEDTRLLQMQQQELAISRNQSLFQRSMTEERLSYKSLEDRLRHLKDAYTAALFLESAQLLPTPDTLTRLEARINEIHAAIAQRDADKNAK